MLLQSIACELTRRRIEEAHAKARVATFKRPQSRACVIPLSGVRIERSHGRCRER